MGLIDDESATASLPSAAAASGTLALRCSVRQFVVKTDHGPNMKMGCEAPTVLKA